MGEEEEVEGKMEEEEEEERREKRKRIRKRAMANWKKKLKEKNWRVSKVDLFRERQELVILKTRQ